MKKTVLKSIKKNLGLVALFLLLAVAVTATSCEPEWDPDDPYYYQ